MNEPLGAPDDYIYTDTVEGSYYTCLRCSGAGESHETVEHKESCVLLQLKGGDE